jgi:phospholipid-binding lipoprotein MlaA
MVRQSNNLRNRRSRPCSLLEGTAPRAAVILLLTAALLVGGCAAVRGSQGGPGREDPPPAAHQSEKLPFPVSPRMAPLEPTVVSYPNYRDPLIWVNRGIFAFNDVTYRYLLIPLGKGYVRVVPDPVRQGVDNLFFNLKTPIYAVNHLLQFRPKPLGRDLARFTINTTLGLLGLFDPAKAWFGLPREETHFDTTLSRYGAGYGIYLVLPIFGPSDLRGPPSLVVDALLNPLFYLTDNPERSAIEGFDFFQAYAPGAERYQILRRKSEDPYIFFRNLYLQGVQRDVDY